MDYHPTIFKYIFNTLKFYHILSKGKYYIKLMEDLTNSAIIISLEQNTIIFKLTKYCLVVIH